MKKLIILPLVLVSFFSSVTAKTPTTSTPSGVLHMDTASFKVYGNCGMCKKRIEGALSEVKGVEKASWDVKSKVLTVKFDPHVISLKTIKEKIAAAGHDTDETTADDNVYNKLPGCCQYDRK